MACHLMEDEFRKSLRNIIIFNSMADDKIKSMDKNITTEEYKSLKMDTQAKSVYIKETANIANILLACKEYGYIINVE